MNAKDEKVFGADGDASAALTIILTKIIRFQYLFSV